MKYHVVSIYSNHLCQCVVLQENLQSRGQMLDVAQRCVYESVSLFVSLHSANKSCIYHSASLFSLQENHLDHNYEEIQVQNQQVSSGQALLSVYATVNASTDQVHYSSVVFQKDSDSVHVVDSRVSTHENALPDSNTNGSSACVYASVRRTPAAEETMT